MNKLRLIFKYSDIKIKALIVIAVVYISVSFSITTIGAINEFSTDDTIQTVTVTLKDGAKDEMTYLVSEGTVGEIIDRLHLNLSESDYVNLDLNQPYSEDDIIEITRITQVKETIEEAIAFTISRNADNSVNLFSEDRIVQEGQDGVKEVTYLVTYENGARITSELVEEAIVSEPVEQVTGYGTVQQGATFVGWLTSYGADCAGCSGRTAAGVDLTNGVNQSGKATYSLNGNEYYVLAADKSIPFGTIIKISNHGYSLPDPIYGIVLDRGGAINGAHIDLYYGLQNGTKFFSGGSSRGVQFEIISIGNGGRY